MVEMSRSRSRAWRWLIAAAISAIVVIGVDLGLRHLEHRLRDEIVQAIEGTFDGRAELDSLHISLFPTASITGARLKLHQHGADALPPLVSLDAFSVEASLAGLLRSPRRIRQLSLIGLTIQIPPKASSSGSTSPSHSAVGGNARSISLRGAQGISAKASLFHIDHILADGTRLVILPKSREKDPLVFELFRLTLRPGSEGRPMAYQAKLKNAKPPGLIDTTGEFGPWCTEDSGATPVSGTYVFRNADLSVFRGISGKLSSAGTFRGVLRRIEASGTTDVPDFALETGGHPVHLQTEFDATIDGTNGDTLLQPVIARFGDSTLVCNGGVYRREGQKGKSVVLDTQLREGRIEDVLRLVISGEPPLAGTLSFKAKMDLPPGEEDVVEALILQGSFGVRDAEFAMPEVQQRIEKLSLRGRGRHEDSTDERIVSDLSGSFVLRDAVAVFSGLSFSVPGARVQLEGEYGLVTEVIDFEGKLLMEVKVSKTQTGIKSLLLKVVDPFLKGEDAGTELPIRISGTRQEPKFGLRLWGSKRKK
ncbi:MAG: hypothetical protein AB1714_26880 [Acidobacteriota bacterium]